MEVSDSRQRGDEGHHHQHHVCGRCGYPFPNPRPSAKHRRAHKKHCGKIEGYIILDASGKTNGADEEDRSSQRGIEAEEITCTYPEADSFELKAAPIEPETLEEDVLLKVEQIIPENKVTEPNILVQTRQLATDESIEAPGGNDLDILGDLEPRYTSSESADANYIDTYAETMGNKSAPAEILDHKYFDETFNAHIVDVGTETFNSESNIHEITNKEFQQDEEIVSTIPDETDREVHHQGESKKDSDLSSNDPIPRSNLGIVEIETEGAAVLPNKYPKTEVTIQTDEEREYVLHTSVIPDTSKTIYALEETNIGVFEQSLPSEVFLPKDQGLDTAAVIIDTSVDTSSQSDSVDGQWGSVSDVLHGYHRQDDSREDSEIHNQDALHKELPSNTWNKEPSSEIEMSQKPHKIAEVNDRDDEIITKVVNWDSENMHTPLKNLLVQATREIKQKAGNSTTLPVPTPTMNAQKTKAQASALSQARKVDDDGEWNSPARLPVRKHEKRFKAKSSWVPFICCSSLN